MKSKVKKSMSIPRKGKRVVDPHPESYYITQGLEKYADYKDIVRYPEEVLPPNKASKFRRVGENSEKDVCDLQELRSVDLKMKSKDTGNWMEDLDREFDLELDLELEGKPGESMSFEDDLHNEETVKAVEDIFRGEDSEWGNVEGPVDEVITVTEETELLFEELISDDELGIPPSTVKVNKGMKGTKNRKPKPPKSTSKMGLGSWIKNFFMSKPKKPKRAKTVNTIESLTPNKRGTKQTKQSKSDLGRTKQLKTGGQKPLKAKGLKAPKPFNPGKINIKTGNEGRKSVSRNTDAVNSLLNSQTYRPGKEIINKNEKVDGGGRDE